ncbi:MAG: hypothetical protein IPN71_17060 [Fibrobacteres bacterium]|nr:hypothetical protein [Fibrobacterota bacterium]
MKSKKFLRWVLKERLPDSTDWLRIEIQSSLTSCGRTLLITDSSPQGQIIDSPCVVLSEQLVHVRINPYFGQSFSTDSLFPWPQQSWISRWESTIHLDSSYTTQLAWTDNHYSQDKVIFLRSITQSRGQLDIWSASNEQTFFLGLQSAISSSSEFRLLSVVAPKDSSGTGVHPKALPKSIHTLGSLALEFPNTPVRWSTASGRTGTMAASEFVRSPAALRGKTLFLQARLPDGRLWQGTHVMP